MLESDEFEGTMGPVARLYLAYFQRAPDFEGFEYYIDARDGGRDLTAIADEFADSREFAERYGALDNAQFLERLARNVPDGIDDARRERWLTELDAGLVTRGQVALQFSESEGFRAASDNEVFVAIAYAETLQRAPDAADRRQWVAFLDAGHSRGELVAALLQAHRPR